MSPVVDLGDDDPDGEKQEGNHKEEDELDVGSFVDVPANDLDGECRQDTELRTIWTGLELKKTVLLLVEYWLEQQMNFITEF